MDDFQPLSHTSPRTALTTQEVHEEQLSGYTQHIIASSGALNRGSDKQQSSYKEHIISIFSRDMGEDLATKIMEKYSDNVDELAEIYEITADLWTPIIIEFAKWCDGYSQKHPGMSLKFAMRDSEPFALAYNILKNNGKFNEEEYKKSLIWINRKVCGIKTEDKDSKSILVDRELFREYTRQEGLDKPFFFVDAGCWGTIIKQLYSMTGIDFCGVPLFFFSHNRNIPSFLDEKGIPEGTGEVFNDSIESFFPKQYESVEKFVRYDGKVVPKLVKEEKMEKFYTAFKERLMCNIQHYVTWKMMPNITDIITRLEEAKEKSKQKFTGVLPQATPGSVDRKKFYEDWIEVFKKSTESVSKWIEYLKERSASRELSA